MEHIQKLITILDKIPADKLYGSDFLRTWDKSRDELDAVLTAARILKELRLNNISPRIFDSGLGVSIFRDNSTRTRFSFAGACNLLGLGVQELDEKKSQIAHGETVRETANMISFLTEVIGIRDDMFLGEGHSYMKEVSQAVEEGFQDKILPRRPTLVNLQCDEDHPTQVMADLLHLIQHFGGIKNLRNKKIAMTWAYSPSYGKPLSVPQGVIGLMTRYGMDVSLAYPEGYSLIPAITDRAAQQAEESGGRFRITHSMDEAFEEADIVYPKSWAPFHVMEERTALLKKGDDQGLQKLEAACLENNKRYQNWECTEERMKKSRDGKALYLHCLPADISGVSCEHGEVAASVFERYRRATYQEAGYKPYIIAAMILLAKVSRPASLLQEILFEEPTHFLDGKV